MLSPLSLGVKTKQYFVCSSNVFLDKKTVLKIWINPGLNVTIFRGTGRWTPDQDVKVRVDCECYYLFYNY